MRKRNCRVEIYFTKTELEVLTKKVRKAGLSREGYCRRILNGAEVKEAPPADVPLLIREVRRVGYNIDQILKGGKPLKYPALKPPDASGYFRFHKLGEGYSLEQIKERILQNLQKQVPFPEVEHRPPRRYRVREHPRKKVTGLRALYFRYCYELHIIVKRPASVKRVSFLLREDITKLDRLMSSMITLASS